MTTTRSLSRPRAVIGAVVAALVINLVLWLIGLAAGGSFEATQDGKIFTAAPGGVIFLTVLPLLVGTALAALISLKWVAVIRVAQIVGAVAALGTIALTVQSDFDTVSTVALSLMHVVIAAVLVIGLDAMRRPLVS